MVELLGLGYRAARRYALESTKEITPSMYEVGQSSRLVPDQQVADGTPRIPERTTWIGLEDGTAYLDIKIDPGSCAPVQTPTSPEWSSDLLPISPSSLAVLSPIASPVTTPAATISGYDKDLRELYTRSRAVRDEIFSQWYRLRSLEQEHKRATVTFGALWRPVLALEAWAGQYTAMQHELQQIRDRVATLEQERSRREQ
ncbi:hypothetical protein Tco_0228738 [Tanacetum coccineum]